MRLFVMTNCTANLRSQTYERDAKDAEIEELRSVIVSLEGRIAQAEANRVRDREVKVSYSFQCALGRRTSFSSSCCASGGRCPQGNENRPQKKKSKVVQRFSMRLSFLSGGRTSTWCNNSVLARLKNSRRSVSFLTLKVDCTSTSLPFHEVS